VVCIRQIRGNSDQDDWVWRLPRDTILKNNCTVLDLNKSSLCGDRLAIPNSNDYLKSIRKWDYGKRTKLQRF
jgi:hypothetical protein